MNVKAFFKLRYFELCNFRGYGKAATLNVEALTINCPVHEMYHTNKLAFVSCGGNGGRRFTGVKDRAAFIGLLLR